jgi:hypothetical protein
MAADPLANSGHFFGMTTLGATDPFFDNAASTSQYPFHEIPEDAFFEAFEQNLLGDCEISRTLQVDGGSYILRGESAANRALASQEMQRMPALIPSCANATLHKAPNLKWAHYYSAMQQITPTVCQRSKKPQH